MAVAGEHEGAAEIDGERTQPRQRQGQRRRRQRVEEFFPRRPQNRKARHQQDQRQRHAEARPVRRRPCHGEEDQQVDGGVFEEIDAVGEQRDRTDGQRHGKLDAEIREIEQGDGQYDAAQGSVDGGIGQCQITSTGSDIEPRAENARPAPSRTSRLVGFRPMEPAARRRACAAGRAPPFRGSTNTGVARLERRTVRHTPATTRRFGL